MIAYLIHTGVISDSRIGWMRVTSNNGTRHHSNAGVETSHPSLLFQVSWNKVWTVLFSPLTLHIDTSGNYGVGLVVYVSKVGDDKEIGTTEER